MNISNYTDKFPFPIFKLDLTSGISDLLVFILATLILIKGAIYVPFKEMSCCTLRDINQ